MPSENDGPESLADWLLPAESPATAFVEPLVFGWMSTMPADNPPFTEIVRSWFVTEARLTDRESRYEPTWSV